MKSFIIFLFGLSSIMGPAQLSGQSTDSSKFHFSVEVGLSGLNFFDGEGMNFEYTYVQYLLNRDGPKEPRSLPYLKANLEWRRNVISLTYNHYNFSYDLTRPPEFYAKLNAIAMRRPVEVNLLDCRDFAGISLSYGYRTDLGENLSFISSLGMYYRGPSFWDTGGESGTIALLPHPPTSIAILGGRTYNDWGITPSVNLRCRVWRHVLFSLRAEYVLLTELPNQMLGLGGTVGYYW